MCSCITGYVFSENMCTVDTLQDDEAGYTCNCTTGYIFDDMTCVDVDECEEDDDLCNTGDCINTEGSYYCMCDEEHAGKHCEVNIS